MPDERARVRPARSARRALACAGVCVCVCVSANARAQRGPGGARVAGSGEGAQLLATVRAEAGAPEPGVSVPVARSFCGSPAESWVRARLGDRLPSCEARDMRAVVRAVDRTLDRLDVQWRDGGSPRNPASGAVRHASWLLTDDEVLEADDPRVARWAADAARHPQDAYRAAMLRLGGAAGPGIARGRCVLAFDEPPAGLAGAWALMPTGIYRRGAQVAAFVWADCDPDPRDPAVRDERARVFVLASVELRAGEGPITRERARLCLGVDRCVSPP